MLPNNNKTIINKLAKNSVKTNKKQYAILFFTGAQPVNILQLNIIVKKRDNTFFI